jgi:hypothetical protein
MANEVSGRFIDDTEYSYDVTILGLRYEFCQDADVVKGSLSIGVTHRTVEEVDCSVTAGMVPTILTARNGMKVKVDT